MSKREQSQLEAGGFVRIQAKVDSKINEQVVARSYGGDGLGGRVVVRLSADRLGPAEDLAMEYLGLELLATSKPLAWQTKRALGFANWALTHHSAHAKYALALVKRIKATARRAKAKPGHAWDEFTAMASELNKSVRHFLPAFWEEAARIYKDLGNQTYAGRSFNKALEAERVHALDVDREHRRDAVLEFTLSGCLSGKALSEYAQDLQEQFEPAEAYETLRDLVVRRTLGGMAPTANMGKDLIRLAKVAGLDSDAEVERVLEEIISAPAMSRAPLQFWKSVKPHVKRIVKRSKPFAVWLLVHTEPQTRYEGDSLAWAWLELLDGWDALPPLWAKKLPAEPEIPRGRAGWLARLASLEESPDKRVFELIEKMANVLKREGDPVPLFAKKGRWGAPRIDVDVLEAFLDLDIDVADPTDDVQLAFGGWLRAELDHPRRNSQLTHVAEDPRFGPALRAAMPELIAFTGETPQSGYTYGRQLSVRRSFEQAAAEHPAIHDAWWQYLDQQLVRLESGGLPDAEIALVNLRVTVGPRTCEQFPELPKRLEAIDLIASLQRTLVAGVLDEYGWKALEQAESRQKLPVRRRYGDQSDHWVFPLLAYHCHNTLMVVRPRMVDPPRELVLSKQRDVQALLPVAEDELIVYRDQTRHWSSFVRWSSDPEGEREHKESFHGFQPRAVVPWGDGVFCGNRVIKPGDMELHQTFAFFHDGERFWRVSDQNDMHGVEDDVPPILIEVDPETGRCVRESVPAWFEEDLPAGARVDWSISRLLPLPGDLDGSPLGSRDGLIGWKVLRRRGGALVGQGIDGRRVALADLADKPYYQSLVPIAMMDQPGGKSYWIFTEHGLVIDLRTSVAIGDFRGRRMTYGAGQPARIPVEFLHLMQVRHEASSKRLRKLSRSDATQLFKAAVIEHQALRQRDSKGKPERTAASAAVEKILSDVPSRLVKGVARIARICAEAKISLDNLRAFGSSDAAGKSGSERSADGGGVTAARISEGMLQLDIPCPGTTYIYRKDGDAKHDQHIREVARFLAGETNGPVSACSTPWLNLWLDLPWLVWRCFWRLAAVEGRHATIAGRVGQSWLDALEHLAGTGILDLPGSFRLHIAKPIKKKPGSRHWVQGNNRYLAQSVFGYFDAFVHILEYAPENEFQTPNGYVIEETDEAHLIWTSKQLQMFVDAVRQVEELPFAKAEQLEEAASLLQVTPVEVAIVWMGNLRTTQYGTEKLTKEIRSHHGWKVKPVQEAIASLEACPVTLGVIDRPVHDDPAAPFGERQPQAFDAMVAAWKKSQSESVRMSPDLIALLNKSRDCYQAFPIEGLLRLLTEGLESAVLRPRKFSFSLDTKYQHAPINPVFDPPKIEDEDLLIQSLPFAIRIINYAAPSGDPVRRALPNVIDAVRTYLDHKSTVFPFGRDWAVENPQEVDVDEVVARVSQLLGKPANKGGLKLYDDGFVLAALVPPHIQLMFRSAALRDEQALERLVAVASLTWGWEGAGERAVDAARVVQDFRSDMMKRIAAINRDNPVDDGGWEQDPRLSAAKTVAAVKKKLKLNEESCAVYLQLLALPDPTNANVRKWNDWSAKQLNEAIAPLIEAGHVVEAKRARAGRSVFLPGGWEALKIPNLPIESWKLPLYGLDSSDLEAIRHQMIVLPGPVGDLFVAAWKRVASGDVPRYEEVV